MWTWECRTNQLWDEQLHHGAYLWDSCQRWVAWSCYTVGCCERCGIAGREVRGTAWPPNRSVVQIFCAHVRASSLWEHSPKMAVHNLFNTVRIMHGKLWSARGQAFIVVIVTVSKWPSWYLMSPYLGTNGWTACFLWWILNHIWLCYTASCLSHKILKHALFREVDIIKCSITVCNMWLLNLNWRGTKTQSSYNLFYYYFYNSVSYTVSSFPMN